MKFKAHQSFFIRKGWLSKGLNAIKHHPSIFMPSQSKKAMDELGLGSNQVMALRYWLQTTELVKSVNRGREHKVSDIGLMMLEHDPYMEEVGTIWALQCNLASNRESATAWYFFFNEFKARTFTKDDFTASLGAYVASKGEGSRVALSSLEADFNCILGTYIPHDRSSRHSGSPENVISSPFGDLGLVGVDNAYLKTYRKRSANLTSLPAMLVLYAICAMRMMEGEDAISEMPLDALLNAPGSPGRVYNLDSISLLSKLYELENMKQLRINRTAGLDVVRLASPQMTREECLDEYYGALR